MSVFVSLLSMFVNEQNFSSQHQLFVSWLQGETGGLNCTLTNLMKKELNDVKTILTTAEAKYDRLKEELDDIKRNLTSSEENFNAVTRELANVKGNYLSSSEAKFYPVNQELAVIKRKLSKLLTCFNRALF